MEKSELENLFDAISTGGFDRIAIRLRLSWGTAEGEAYLRTLIVDERGNRLGFPPEVFAAIIKLANNHPQCLPPVTDVWGSNEFKHHRNKETVKWTSNRDVDTQHQRFRISPLTLSLLTVCAWLLWKVYFSR